MSCTKLQLPPEPLTKGLPPPDPRPLSSTEFVEPPPEKIPGYATVCDGLITRPEESDCGASLCVIKKPRKRGGQSPLRGCENTAPMDCNARKTNNKPTQIGMH